MHASYWDPAASVDKALVSPPRLHTARAARFNAMFNQAQETFRSEPLTTLDLTAGFDASSGRWGVDLIARNMTKAIAADFQGRSVDPRFYSEASPNQGRTLLVTVRAHY